MARGNKVFIDGKRPHRLRGHLRELEDLLRANPPSTGVVASPSTSAASPDTNLGSPEMSLASTVPSSEPGQTNQVVLTAWRSSTFLQLMFSNGLMANIFLDNMGDVQRIAFDKV